ncbi:uncharacterized protein [Halyomorpha halys]|uniref:uncharacterized protein n=1 Tax=Halyomorpha halys TaxID=286706 RepID=UPI0034D17B61
MHYLKSALSGEPASLLARFPFNASSYQPAWDALVREYNNPRVLASRCLLRVLNHKCPTSGGERAKYASYLAEVGEGIEAFRGLALEDESDVILSTLALRALDPVTRRHFELAHASSEFPTVDDIAFVRQRLMACKLSHELDMQPHSDAPRAKPAGRGKGGISLLASEVGTKGRSPGLSESPPRRTSPGKSGRSGRRQSPGTSSRGKSVSPGKERCPRCEGRHLLGRCYKFLALTLQERNDFIKSSGLCRNSLRSGHHASKCPSEYTCTFCRANHHSVLHVENRSCSSAAITSPKSADFVGHTRVTSGPHDCCPEAVMGTACAVLHSAPARLLLDSGSQYTFVTAELTTRIGGQLQSFDGRIAGLGGTQVANIKGAMTFRLRSLVDDTTNFKVRALVVERITSDLPRRPVPSRVIGDLSSHVLADPCFGVPGPIDLLIGVDLYPRLVTGAPTKAFGNGHLYRLPTVLGKFVMGTHSNSASTGISLLIQDDATASSRTNRKPDNPDTVKHSRPRRRIRSFRNRSNASSHLASSQKRYG